MKKKILIIFIVLFLILVIPIPKGQYKDGGTKRYDALTFSIVVWNRFYGDAGEEKIYDKTKIYFIPNNYKTIDELFDLEMNNTE